jgi:cytosine/adenosine deaminase-related metal-dependent hydrolase
VLLTARYVVGHDGRSHVLYENGEVAFSGGRITFVGHGYPGPVARRVDYGPAVIGPGFIDLDALADLDTTVLGFDNHPAWAKGRVWPESYMEAGPFEMYTPEQEAFKTYYAFVQLIRNGITTALPITSLFYREWGETYDEFARVAEIARNLGLRVYLGPAYRTGHTFVRADGRLDHHFDEARGLRGLDDAVRFARAFEGLHGGLVRTMLAPDRIETCTPELLRRSAAASRDLDVPIRLHCCQSRFEHDSVEKLRGMTPIEWLHSLDFLSPRALLPHGVFVNSNSRLRRPGRDLDLIAAAGAHVVHCPIVSARGGNVIESFRRYRALGINIGLGTDTYPPDMLENMRLGLVLCRVGDQDPTACRSEDYYDAATLGGAAALRRDDLGRLSPGARADLAVFDLSDSRLGQVIDPIQTMMLSGSGRNISTVVIDGRFVMEAYRIPGVDYDALAERAQRQFDGLVALYPRRTHRHPPVGEIFSSAYRRIQGPAG